MTKERMQLFLVLLCVFLAALLNMNLKYDVLARNTSVNNSNRELLLKKLSAAELQYIVENSVDVNEFMEFINEPLFKLSNYKLYRQVMDTKFSSTKEIVTFVNAVAYKMETADLLVAITNYTYPTLRKLIVDKSPYNRNAVIVVSPNDVTTVLDLHHTIGEYEPQDLVELNTLPELSSQKPVLLLRQEAAFALSEMCRYLSRILVENCGGFEVESAYLSYYDIQDSYLGSVELEGAQEAFDIWGLPSHNEHQLGLAVDVMHGSREAMDTIGEYVVLLNVAHEYGFIYDSKSLNQEKNGLHIRYIGKEKAKECERGGQCINQKPY